MIRYHRGLFVCNLVLLRYFNLAIHIYIHNIYWQQRNNKLDTNSADEKRTRNKQERDVYIYN